MAKNNILSKKIVQVGLWSAIINILILVFASMRIDIASAILYTGIAVLVSIVWDFLGKPMKLPYIFYFGFVISLSYNVLGILFHWFNADMLLIATGAIQQGIVTSMVALMLGGKLR